jgi:acetyltransferase-like isoleucine patch superfamily enzyme
MGFGVVMTNANNQCYIFAAKSKNVVLSEIKHWFYEILSFIPGRVGILLRREIFSRCFSGFGKPYIEMGCHFEGASSIFINGQINVGRNSLFVATDGQISIGNDVGFNSGVHINSSVGGIIEIGAHCLIGPNVIIRTAGHRFSDIGALINTQGHFIGNVQIDQNVWIGAGSIILGGVRIGEGAIIGAGAVIVNDIPAMSVAVGVPGKVIKFRDGREI